ncbi:hypothetical protein HAX54_039534 [Datura stramonium]|uniref:RING-type domain-containing protein n=1 Tax=Datura stramonium TaxID=4076 RepID=A0ABS8VLG5_DATST|nr:hypothetical protein [Datura stramonium]
MEGGDRAKTLWKNLKRRVRFSGLAGCIGKTRVSDQTVEEEEEEEEEAQYYGEEEPIMEAQYYEEGRGLNLAMVLEAERMAGRITPTTQFKTLMRLFEETDNNNNKEEEEEEEEEIREIDSMCCVCMERNKGAAFIPCGHTYCRICSRQLWLNRGLCPLCNRPIHDILHIF